MVKKALNFFAFLVAVVVVDRANWVGNRNSGAIATLFECENYAASGLAHLGDLR